MDTEKILNQMYPDAVEEAKRETVSGKFMDGVDWLMNRKWRLIIIGFALFIYIAAHLYYYNMLVDLEFNVKTGWAQVEVQLQRRYNIQKNLTRIVIDYSNYEKALLNNLTELRTGGKDSGKDLPSLPANMTPSGPGDVLKAALDNISPSDLNKLTSKIQVVAEQYPDLKLSENFQQFSAAIIDTESQIAAQLMDYNTTVNIYTTVLNQIPGMFFGRVCGFEEYDFHQPESATLEFSQVEY